MGSGLLGLLGHPDLREYPDYPEHPGLKEYPAPPPLLLYFLR
jgi:hypothetical protein